MSTLTPPMIRLIQNFTAGTVATINDDGTPAASPKATFVVKDPACIAFGNIRSPGTVANIRARPQVETVFVDVLTRRAVRVAGRASVVDKTSDAGAALMPVFEKHWGPFLDSISEFVQIDINSAELILSPAYDVGLTAQELRKSNLEALNKL